MTWTKITRTTGDWTDLSRSSSGWAAVEIDPYGDGWFVVSGGRGWYETGWFVGPEGYIGQWGESSNTTGGWTKITNTTGGWTQIR